MSEPIPDEELEKVRADIAAARLGQTLGIFSANEASPFTDFMESLLARLDATEEKLAGTERFASEGWSWVDDFCEAIGPGTTVFNFKDRVDGYRQALRDIRNGNWGDGYPGVTAQSLADAALSHSEAESGEEW